MWLKTAKYYDFLNEWGSVVLTAVADTERGGNKTEWVELSWNLVYAHNSRHWTILLRTQSHGRAGPAEVDFQPAPLI